ncbi:MAG TPA: TetR/AcrR family transcriptional regulator [Stellaceae bacterium]|nr:TetR/AcrR family transcriptional regulator [Stellaceae bacterium]
MAAGDLRWPEMGPRSGAARRGRAATKGKAIRRANGTLVNAGAIRRRNEAKILEAAEAIFAKQGFNGASTAAIARKAGVPKANLHYYFRTKQALYASVLDNILEIWLDAMDEIRPEADPADALSRYIARKIESSRTLPEPSRLWAMELLGGARHVHPFLEKRLRRMVREKSTIIKSWIRAGKMAPVDPPHLLFAIWAMTQTYADFAAQMAPVLGKKRLDDDVFRAATETVTTLVLRGLGLRR